MGRWPVHPLLLGVWPVLLLWAENAREVASDDVLPVLGWMLLGAVLGTATASLLLRDLRRGSLVASAGLLLYALYGRVGGADLHPAGDIVLVAVALACVALIVLRVRERGLETLTGVANVAALALVVVSLPAVVHAVVTPDARPVRATPAPSATGDTAPARDIFYVVLDRYPRQDSLRTIFEFDNSPFLDGLEERGFQVADRSVANYPKTAHSLAASLGLDYLDELEDSVPSSRSDDWGPVYGMMDEHRLGEILTEAGYTYTHLGSWWSPTKEAASADRILNYDTRSEFAEVYDGTTLLPSIRSLAGGDRELSGRELIRNHTLYAFDQLEELARQDPARPRFVFAHITLPHEPYVFAADGSYVTEEQEAARTRERNIVEQVRYANLRLERLVAALLDRPADEQPIVVLQSDEGPHPAQQYSDGQGYSFADAPLAELREKLRILNAYYLPGTDVVVRDDITPVNTFRLLLDTYLGTDFGQLPDRAYIFPDEANLYTFTEVTDRVR